MEKKPDYLGLYCQIVVWGLFVLLLLACAYLFLQRSMNTRESETAQRSFINLLNTQEDLNFTSKKFISKVEEQFQLHNQLMQSVTIRDANNNNLLNSFYRENDDLDKEGQLLGGFFNDVQYKKSTDYLNFSENNSVLALEATYYVLPMSQLYNIVSLFFYICVTFLVLTLVILLTLLRRSTATKPQKSKRSILSTQENFGEKTFEKTESRATLSPFDEEQPLDFEQNNLLFEDNVKDETLNKGENPFHIFKEQEEKEGTKEEVESLFDFFDEEKSSEKKSDTDEQLLSEIFDKKEQHPAEDSDLHSFPESLISEQQKETDEATSFESSSEETSESFESLETEATSFESSSEETVESFESLETESTPFDSSSEETAESFESLETESAPFDSLSEETAESFASLDTEAAPFDSLSEETAESFAQPSESVSFDDLAEDQRGKDPFVADGEQAELTEPRFKGTEIDVEPPSETEERQSTENIFEELENELDKLSQPSENSLEQVENEQNFQDLNTNLSEKELLLWGGAKENDMQSVKEDETAEFLKDKEELSELENESNSENLHELPSQPLAANPLTDQASDIEQRPPSHFSDEAEWQKFLEHQKAPLSSLIDPLLMGEHDFSLSLLSAGQPLKELFLEKFDNEDLFFVSEYEAVIVLRDENLANAVEQLQTKLQTMELPELSCGVSAYSSERINVDNLTLLEEARYAWLNTSSEKSISAYSAL